MTDQQDKPPRRTGTAINPVGRPRKAEVATLPTLTAEQLDAVRDRKSTRLNSSH